METLIFQSCRDQDSSRLKNLEVVETETHRDWPKVVETETFSRVFLFTDRNTVGFMKKKVYIKAGKGNCIVFFGSRAI